MKRMIALLLLLCMLTACAAPVPETEEPTAASQEIAVPEQKQPDSGTMTGAATFTQAASEPLTYTVVLKTLEDSAAAADGTTLAVRSYELPEMTVTLPDGTVPPRRRRRPWRGRRPSTAGSATGPGRMALTR